MTHLIGSTMRSQQLHGVSFTPYANSQNGTQRLAAWLADFPPQTPGTAHSMTEEEILFLVTGTLTIEIDDESFEAQAGDAVVVPAGSAFRVSNDSELPAQAWVTTTLGMTAQMLDSGQNVTPPWAQ